MLPDMIGGNVYNNEGLPSSELFIRWMQLNTFLPSMQFSISPWQYEDDNNETMSISSKFMKIFEKYVSTIVKKIAQECTQRGSDPIVRPLYYLDPTDKETFTIDDQFLLGSDHLVAPVTRPMLEGGTVSKRDIYLPGGSHGITWHDVTKCDADQLIGGAIDCAVEIKAPAGGLWIQRDVPIEDCPLFIRET